MISVELDEAVGSPVYGFQFVYGDNAKGSVEAGVYEIRGIHESTQIKWDSDSTPQGWTWTNNAMGEKILRIDDHGTYFDLFFTEPIPADNQVVAGEVMGITAVYAMVD